MKHTAMLAFGTFMADGALLAALSRMRYVLHGGLIPLIFALCAYALNAKDEMKAALEYFGVKYEDP